MKTGEINLSNQSKLVFTIPQFAGKTRLDIRVHINDSPDASAPNWIITKKGINVPEELFDDFRKMIDLCFTRLDMGDSEGEGNKAVLG